MAEIADLPESLRLLVEREVLPPLKAAGDVELDLPENIYKASRWLAMQPVPVDGGGTANHSLYAYAAMLKDYAISEERARTMLEEHLPGYQRIEETVASAYGRGNDPGSRATTYGVESVEIAKPALAGELGGKPKGLLGRGSDVKDRAVVWLWPGWLARGKFEVFGGGKGAGKSTIGYDLAARLTSGGKWPDGSKVERPRDVLVWSGEDDIEDAIVPRFRVAGGDPDRLYYVENIIADGIKRAFDPSTDIPILIEMSREISDLGLILIDPVVSAVGGDSHKNAETRRGLQPLVEFAKERDAALIGITHFTKGTQGRNPVERITGSLAFGALARVVFGAVKSDDPKAPRSFVRLASNIGPDGNGFEYTLEQHHVPGRDYLAQRVVWGKALEGDAMTLLNMAEAQEAKGTESPRGRAAEWLRELLAAAPGRQIAVREIQEAARANSHVWKTVERAKAELPIRAVQNLGAAHGGWNWKWLPQDDTTATPILW